MAKIITVTTQKGGAGKTTISLLLATGEALKGKRVLLVDLDQQGDATYSLVSGFDPAKTSYELLTDETASAKAVANPVEGLLTLDLVPASLTLERVEVELAGVLDAQFILSDKLEAVKDDYDLIVIDTPPSLNVIVSNALTAADKLIIPVQADIYSLKGMATLAQRVKAIQRRSNPGLSICGIVLNRYNPRTNLSKAITEALTEVAEQFNTKVYRSTLRDATAVREAQNAKQSLFEYAKGAKVTEDAKALLSEIEEDLNNG